MILHQAGRWAIISGASGSTSSAWPSSPPRPPAAGSRATAATLIALRAVREPARRWSPRCRSRSWSTPIPGERRTGAMGLWAARARDRVGQRAGGRRAADRALRLVGDLLGEHPGLICGIALAATAVRSARSPVARRLDTVGAGVAGRGGLLALTYGLVEPDERAWGATRRSCCWPAPRCSSAASSRGSAAYATPLVELALFRDRAFSAGAVVYGVSYVALTGVFFFVTLYLPERQGLVAGLRDRPVLGSLNLPFLAVTPFAGPDRGPLRQRERRQADRSLGAVAVLWLAGLERLLLRGGVAGLRADRARLRPAGPRGVLGGDGRRAGGAVRRRRRRAEHRAPGRRGGRPRGARLDRPRRGPRRRGAGGSPRLPAGVRTEAATLGRRVAGQEAGGRACAGARGDAARL